MSYYSPNRGMAISDFGAFYLSSCRATIDLYQRGLTHFYVHDLRIPAHHVKLRGGVITVPLDLLPCGVTVRNHLLEVQYSEQVAQRLSKACRMVMRFGNVVDRKVYHRLQVDYTNAVDAMIPLMATSNFVKTFVDPDDVLFKQALSGMPVDTTEFLISQPKATPFLRVLEMATLKVVSGRWSMGRFFRAAAFLHEMDPRMFYFQLEQIDDLVEPIRQAHADPGAAYLSLLQIEIARKTKLRRLRAQAVRRTVTSGHLNLFFAAIDIEEARHYWQARFTRDLYRCGLFLDLPIEATGLTALTRTLKDI